MNIYEETKFIMKKYNVHANKKLGQNFLFDEQALDTIANEVTTEDTIIEIGPGLGTLTAILLQKAKKVIAVELDPNMVEIISERFKMYDNIEIINEDILKLDINKLAPKAKVVANFSNTCPTFKPKYAQAEEKITAIRIPQVIDQAETSLYCLLGFIIGSYSSPGFNSRSALSGSLVSSFIIYTISLG